MNIFYFGGFRSGSTACLKRESNQVYVFIFVENVGDFCGEFDCYGPCEERINAKVLGSWGDYENFFLWNIHGT